MERIGKLFRWLRNLIEVRGPDRLTGKLMSGIGVERSPRRPLEVIPDILDAAADLAAPAGGGVWVFPYDRLHLKVLAPGGDRAEFEAVMTQRGGLVAEMRATLEKRHCAPPTGLAIDITYAPERGSEWTHTDFDLRGERSTQQPAGAPATLPPAGPLPKLALEIVAGQAACDRYEFQQSEVCLGRLAWLSHSSGGDIRINHVAFGESDDAATATVSRAHASIYFDARSGCYRIADDNSSEGTSVSRNGRVIGVPRGSRIGVALRHGDEVYLGRARLRVGIITG